MVEENKKQVENKEKKAKETTVLEEKVNEKPKEIIVSEEKKENKENGKDKEETKKEPIVKKLSKKKEASVQGRNLSISTKHAIAICNFIRNKNIERAIKDLEGVSKMKTPLPMRGEIPHKKGIMSGRYPINATNEVIKLLKSLVANAIVNELELEKVKISCKANIAARPYRRAGRTRFKRTNLEIKLIPKKSNKKNKGDKK